MKRPKPGDWLSMFREDSSSGCWVWAGRSVSSYGYGRFRGEYVHRISYEHHVGQIPSGMHIDHLCRNRLCINPMHLQAVTPWLNVMRGESGARQNRNKAYCDNGHEFNEENTYIRKDGRGRKCRACNRERERARNAKKRSAERGVAA